MSKKRVAYFYDEDVGNFHYGEYLKANEQALLGRQAGIASVYLHNTHRDVLNRNICHFIGGYFVAIPGIFCTISLSYNPISDRYVQA